MTIAPPPIRAWAHQTEAVQFVQNLWRQGRRGAMLAMVMGAGKTKVAIDLAVALGVRLILILCPLRVVEVWRTQFERFAPGQFIVLPLDDAAGSVREKTRLARDMVAWSRERNRPVVIAVNYESARTDPFAHWALANAWGLTILDESHRIKEPAGRTSRWCSKLGLRSHYRLCLTGTPMPHAPIDIWGQFHFLDPSILDPTFGSFRLRYAVMGGYLGKQAISWRDLDELYAKFRRIAFRVDESVLDLPPELDETLTTEMGATGARLYREMEEEMVAWIASSEAAGVPVTAANAMVRLLRLQQITGGSVPDELGEDHHVDDAKEDLLVDFLEDLPEKEPVVVFALFKPDLAAIHRACLRTGRSSGELSGNQKRAGDLAEWQAGRLAVLATQIQAGNVGIDLTRARLAVYYSLGFSLANYLQSRARIRRPPQQRPCAFYHLQVRNSVDQYVLRAVLARQDLIASCLEELKKHVHRTD